MILPTTLVFDTETIPDVEGLRKTLHISENFNDHDVVSIANYHYRQKKKGQIFCLCNFKKLLLFHASLNKEVILRYGLLVTLKVMRRNY